MNKSIERKLAEGRQYRLFSVGRENLRTLDDGGMIVEGYATVFDTPYILYSENGYTVREQIDRHAFDGCDMSDVIFQYDHAGHVYARTSNETMEVEPDEKGLKTRIRLDGTTIGRQLYEEIDGGYTTKMSFGFVIAERRRDIVEDSETGAVDVLVTITRIKKLFDCSAVSIPANDATSISARSLCDGVIAEARQELLERRRKKEIIKLLLED